jgi:hypothetical protein
MIVADFMSLLPKIRHDHGILSYGTALLAVTIRSDAANHA